MGSSTTNAVDTPGRPAIVLASGDHARQFLPPLPDPATVIAADSGAALAATLGRPVDVLVGDLDSIETTLLGRLRAGGTTIEHHPRDKDETDLELALQRAVDGGASTIHVLGGGGGALSHLIANVELVCSTRWRGTRLRWWNELSLIVPVHDVVQLELEPGTLVSLVAAGGDAAGVTTSGLRWVLDGDSLPHGATRGVSNVADDKTVRVRVGAGTVAVIVDDASAVRS